MAIAPYPNVMWYVLLFILNSILVLPAFAVQPAFHICYFSLNNEKEFQATDKFIEKLNKVSTDKIIVTEYVNPNKKISTQDAFKAMIETGTQCDGLVISGHHTGAFGGERAQGQLDINFLEKLSCDDKYSDWFNHIHALWLQGCRTLGVGAIAADEVNDDQLNADFHTNRVGNVLDEDHLTQNLAQLNMEFSATLDQDNPLSSRYLRLFPAAKVFGWTRSAPGVEAQSELSVPFHIAHIAKLTNDNKFPKEIPTAPTISPQSAVKYMNALFLTLGQLQGQYRDCEALATQGWLDHGHVTNAKNLGFDNPDLNAYLPLIDSDDGVLKQARVYGCLLKKDLPANDRRTVINAILDNPNYIGYFFQSMWELMNRLNPEDKKAMQEQLLASDNLRNFLNKKLLSKQLGILLRIDYYAFYKDLTQQKNQNVEDLLREEAEKIFLQPLATATAINQELSDFIYTVKDSIIKNDLLTPAFIEHLLDKHKDPYTVKLVLSILLYSDVDIPNLTTLLKNIMAAPKINSDMLASVVSIMNQRDLPIEEAKPILKTIALSPICNSECLYTVIGTIGEMDFTVIETDEFLEKLMHLPNINASTLAIIGERIIDQEIITSNPMQQLQTIITDPKIDGNSLGDIANTFGYAKKPILGSAQLLTAILDSPKVNSATLSQITYAIQNSQTPISNARQLLIQIINSPKASKTTLKIVLNAIGHAYIPITDPVELIDMIMSRDSSAETLNEVAYTIGNLQTPIADASQRLQAILHHPNANAHTIPVVTFGLINSKFPIANKQELLQEILDSQRNNIKIIESIVYNLQDSNSRDADFHFLFKKILDLPNINGDILNAMAVAIKNSKNPNIDYTDILQDIASSPKADVYTKVNVVEAIGGTKSRVIGAENLLSTIMNANKTNTNILSAVAQAIGNTHENISNAIPLLEDIMATSSARPDTLGTVARTIGHATIPVEQANQMLTKIYSDPRTVEYVLFNIAEAIIDMGTTHTASMQLYEDILHSSRITSPTYWIGLGLHILDIDTDTMPIEERIELLKEFLLLPNINNDIIFDILSEMQANKLSRAHAEQFLDIFSNQPNLSRINKRLIRLMIKKNNLSLS